MSAAELLARYELTPGPDEDAEGKARALCLEQTVELPAAVLPQAVADGWTARLHGLEPLDGGVWLAEVGYPTALAGGELTQLLNLLFGNVSLQDGIRLVDLEWPQDLLASLGGPGFGIAGVRRLCGVSGRALLATALKPVGLSATELAARCHDFARGGIDLIKDDHGLANQPSAPFEERLWRCQEAVTRANGVTGAQSLYCPNVTAPRPQLDARAAAAREAGCRVVLVSPWITGLDAMARLRDEHGLAVLAHPALTGALFRPDHGISAPLLLGELFRVAGADAVIYPNAGGRFGFRPALCLAIAERLRRRLGPLHPALPMPGGGMSLDQVPDWVGRYGADTLFLIGGDLYREGDLVAAAGRFRAAIEDSP